APLRPPRKRASLCSGRSSPPRPRPSSSSSVQSGQRWRPGRTSTISSRVCARNKRSERCRAGVSWDGHALEAFMRRVHVTLTALVAVTWVAAIANGCSATNSERHYTTGGNMGGATTTTTEHTGGGATTTSTSSGLGGNFTVGDGGDASDAIDESTLA